MPDNPLNAVNRGVYISDNLPFLQSLNDECIDLVCIDPPFSKNETFGRKSDTSPDPLKPPLTEHELHTELALLRRWGISDEKTANAAGIDWPATRYKDFWSWADVHEQWLKDIEEDYPAVHKLIDTTQEIHGDATAAYLCYMAVRLFDLHRVLKDTGSIYLHCDHTAGAYLRQLMDAIFGKDNFQNNISWKRTSGRSDATRYGRVHDTILFYSKSPSFHWVTPYIPHDPEYVEKTYRNVDSIGRWAPDQLTAAGPTNGQSGKPWRGVDPGENSNHWRTPTAGGMNDFIIERQLIPNWPGAYPTVHERLDALDKAGLIYWPPTGRIPRLKRYYESTKGVALDDIFTDIKRLEANSVEKTGYPTQKPVALAERIIKASCPENGVVLDCFAGCAYVAIAAERLNRDWVTCDINPRAWTVFKRQFSKPKLVLLNCSESTHIQQPSLIGNIVTVHGPNELPVRQTPEPERPTPTFKPEPAGFKVPASLIPEPEMLQLLLELSGYKAWCCGFANRRPDGQIIQTTRNFHLDHLAPKSKDGFSNEIMNRAPMCPFHNIRKGNRRIALSEYREEIALASDLMVDSIEDLIPLNYAAAQAAQIYGQAYARAHPQGLMRI